MDIQIINLRMPADLAKRARAVAGPRGLTAFILQAVEASLTKSPKPTQGGVPPPHSSPDRVPSKGPLTRGSAGGDDPFITPDRVQVEPNTKPSNQTIDEERYRRLQKR